MQQFKTALTAAAFALVAASGLLITSSQAANDKNPTQDEKLKIQIGQKINPVSLNMSRKEADTVYLGSYLVNVASGCGDCHTAPAYAEGGNPYFGQPEVLNAAKFLGGGATFGPFTSRNITPDLNGKPAGMSFPEFEQAVRNGKDWDNAHPQFGPLLQVMPWPVYHNLTDRDLNAIYTYLSAIPCLEGDPGVPSGDGVSHSSRCH